MSVILKLTHNSSIDNICLIYNFKQINDSILAIMYVDKLHTWEKVFISYSEGTWDTSVLAHYTDNEMYQQICSKLKFIFIKHEHATEERALCLEKTMQEDAAFMLGVFS